MSSVVTDTLEITVSSLIGGAITAFLARLVHGRISPPKIKPGVNSVILWALLGALVVGSAAYFLIRPTFMSPCPVFASTDAPITTPTDGSVVSQSIIVRGTACHIPQGNQLWLLVMAEGVTGYYPQSGPIVASSDGKWSASAFLGGTDSADSGRAFVLYTASVDQGGSAATAIQNYFASSPDFRPISPLPDGIHLLSQVQVVRA